MFRRAAVERTQTSVQRANYTEKRAPLYLGDSRLLTQTNWGGYVVVPSWNIDVAVGPVRDGIHEAWTTRLVQELLRPGQVYLNAGANYGYYVALGGRIVGETGTVFAIEPNPYIVPFLLHTVYWNGTVNNIRIYRVALSDQAAPNLSMHFDPQYLGGGHMSELDAESPEYRSFNESLWTSGHWNESGDGRVNPACGNYVSFSCQAKTIDEIVPNTMEVDLIHLDIEGAEPRALLGGRQTIRRSTNLRLITEWASYHYRNGSDATRRAHDDAIDMLLDLGYRVRHLQPRLSNDGGLYVSAPLTKEYLQTEAPHGDYVWVRAKTDPWG